MTVHSIRLQRTQRRRVCSSCGSYIKRGDKYWARNGSVCDTGGTRYFGFFSTHRSCESVIVRLGHGLGVSAEGVISVPGWLGSLEDVGDGLEGLSEDEVERLSSVVGSKKVERGIEYRYYDPVSGERMPFLATVSEMEEFIRR